MTNSQLLGVIDSIHPFKKTTKNDISSGHYSFKNQLDTLFYNYLDDITR